MASQSSGSHELYVTLLAELVGISVLAIVADMSDNFGRIAVALMGGWLFLFLISNDQFLQGITGKLGG